MFFDGTNKQFVELMIHEFEEPPVVINEEDDWLKIFFNIKHNEGNWGVIDTCLTLAEYRMMIKWFDALSSPWPLSNQLYFMEPNLSFHHLLTRESGKTIKINLDLELKPSWADRNTEYFVVCRYTDAELKQVARDLEKELQKFFDRYEVKLMKGRI